MGYSPQVSIYSSSLTFTCAMSTPLRMSSTMVAESQMRNLSELLYSSNVLVVKTMMALLVKAAMTATKSITSVHIPMPNHAMKRVVIVVVVVVVWVGY